MMKRFLLLTAFLFVFAAPGANAQSTSTTTYDFILARFAAEAGDFDKALALIDSVVQKHPSDPIVLFERASILLDAGQVDRAIREMKAIVLANPSFYDAQRLLGRVLLDRARTGNGGVDEALAHLQAALKASPDDTNTGLLVAQLLVAGGKMTDAEKLLSGMVERSPDSRSLNLAYAQVLTKLGRPEQAVQYLEKVVAADPSYVPAVMQLVDFYQKSSQWKKAADVLSSLASDDPANVELQRQLGYFHLRAGESEKAQRIFNELSRANPEDDRNRFFLAESLTDMERYAEAEKLYRGLLEESPNDPEILMSYALNLAAQRKLDEAAKAFETLLALPALPPGVLVLTKTQLAVVNYQRGNLDRALTLAREVTLGPNGLNSQAVGITLEVLRKQKKYDEAITFLQPLVERYNEPGLSARLIEFLIRADRNEEAEKVATSAARAGTRGAVAVAEAYVSTRRFADAVKVLEGLRKANPEDLAIGYQLASALERSGEIQKAEKLFLELLEKSPDNASILNYLGYMWADRGVNLERAEELLKQAVALDPDNGAYLDSLGWAYFKLGKLDLAEKYLADAAVRMPNDPTIQEHLGDLFSRKGQSNKALERYRAALNLDPEPKEEQKIRVKIAEVEKKSATDLQ